MRYGIVSLAGLLLGVVLWSLLCYHWLGVEVARENSYFFKALPEDDSGLAEWFRSRPGVSDVAVDRQGDHVLVRYREFETGSRYTLRQPPFEDLGYVRPAMKLRTEEADDPAALWHTLRGRLPHQCALAACLLVGLAVSLGATKGWRFLWGRGE